MAGAQYRAQITWVEGLQFKAQGMEPESEFMLDGAKEHGGTDQGMRPFEALLCSLAGCSSMDVIMILQKMRQDVTGLQVSVVGERGEDYPRPLVKATLEYVVRGHEISPQAVERAIRLSQTKYCGVIASVKAEIRATFRIEQE